MSGSRKKSNIENEENQTLDNRKNSEAQKKKSIKVVFSNKKI